MLSMNGSRIKSPGPFGPPATPPGRRITPRPYSLTTLIALIKIEATKMRTTATATNPMPTGIACKSAKYIRRRSSQKPMHQKLCYHCRGGGQCSKLHPPKIIATALHAKEKGPGIPPGPFSDSWPKPAALQKPSRPHVARDRVDRRPLGDVAGEGGGVDGGAVPHRDADVGDVAAAVLAP